MAGALTICNADSHVVLSKSWRLVNNPSSAILSHIGVPNHPERSHMGTGFAQGVQRIGRRRSGWLGLWQQGRLEMGKKWKQGHVPQAHESSTCER